MAELLARVATVETKATELAIERLALSKEAVLAELWRIGSANMLDYMRVGHDGDPVLCFGSLTRDQAAALAEVTVEDFKDGRGDDARDVRRVKFKLHDKRGALTDLGRHFGLFVDHVDVNVKHDVTDQPMSTDEWARSHVTEH